MSTLISVSWSNSQSNYGYQLSVIEGEEEIHYVSRIGQDPGEAAAQALIYQARYGGRIVANKKVMDIVNDK